MTSFTAENKRLALDKLRFSRNSPVHRDQALASSSAVAQEDLRHPQPPQSRDGSVSSRFFPSSPSSLGNVLVPNSSPIAQNDYPIRPYRPYDHLTSHPIATSSSSFASSSWLSASLASAFDPLSAPGGLISHGKLLNATSRRQLNEDDNLREEEGPPRKRINRGLSEDVCNIPKSPSSPEIRRAGHRRHMPSIGADVVSLSSDDSTQDSGRVDVVSRPRLTKERPASSPDTTPMSDVPSDREYISFKISHPTESPVRVQAAWKQASGDAKRATSLLLDPTWSPSSAASREVSSRVKEIDEATRAQRAAEKEKGKKSMIYANRSILDDRPPVTPTPQKPVINLITPTPALPNSPLSPALKVPQRKRAKKLVINSDSESIDDNSGDERTSAHGISIDVFERRALEYLNTSNSDALQDLTGCTSDQAQAIISLRPFTSGDDIRSKLGQGKKKATGISPRMFEECTEMFKGYGSVDNVLEDCERIGCSLRAVIDSWNPSEDAQPSEDGTLSLLSLGSLKSQKNYLSSQPGLLSDTVTLKEYQLLGVNWLNLLYHSNLSCILADEMGLGKTIQVISFLAHLKQTGDRGPHLIVVPSSTLENWCREFARFAPTIAIQTYYGEKNVRAALRQSLRDTQKRNKPDGWEVLITTYNLAQGDERDRHFFRKLEWDCCIYDEGHVLKNFQSQRYQSLLKFPYNWRLLLTGTPLQNNLQELVSLLNFILPDQFAESLEHLRAIFKVKGDAKVSLLSQERISRAKKMMTPFVLRRRKDQVLKDLPAKTERIEWCDMTELQRSIYRDTLKRSRKTVLEAQGESTEGPSAQRSKKARESNEKLQSENSTNVLMDLRKAASHPMLFRNRFNDEILAVITKQLLKEPDFKKRGAQFDFVMEDMSVMTDAELQLFCASYKSTRKYRQNEACYADAGKVQILLRLLANYGQEQRKVLIFSQFTQILDILQVVLDLNNIKFLVLTGSTPVDVRQTLVDEFTEDESIPVFLLSTKAGGMGINLTAASAVIMFDQDFNPHNDRQAQDRAYRIGQKRDVEVVKLISKGTIEEDMLQLGQTKLALDEAVAGDSERGGECAPERTMKTSLMNALRQQFEKDEGISETVPG